MSKGRTLVVGDIHGCYDELIELLDKARLGLDERVVAVGDLIVKGPRSREVLDLFASDARFSSVLGNHDLALLRFWRGESVELTPAQKSALSELDTDRERYRGYLESLPLMIDLGEHLVVHAGLRPGVALASQSVDDLTELRTLGSDRTSREGTPWYDAYDGDKIVLFGHWPARQVRRGNLAIGLDTGCVYGNRLTSYIIETGEFVAVHARRAYDGPKRPLQ
jgi:diadenosine tetraphosphatase ApaH/serine/threonine PP2A family protein phosphatase